MRAGKAPDWLKRSAAAAQRRRTGSVTPDPCRESHLLRSERLHICSSSPIPGPCPPPGPTPRLAVFTALRCKVGSHSHPNPPKAAVPFTGCLWGPACTGSLLRDDSLSSAGLSSSCVAPEGVSLWIPPPHPHPPGHGCSAPLNNSRVPALIPADDLQNGSGSHLGLRGV